MEQSVKNEDLTPFSLPVSHSITLTEGMDSILKRKIMTGSTG
jgi:hypothetical protein